MGDQVLQAAAHLLKEQTRSDAMVGWYGGDEFLLVLPILDLPKVVAG